MARRILFLAVILVFPCSLFAQNDIGVWLNTNQYKSTTLSDGAGGTFRLKVDQRLGYGISFNHFSGPNLSTELAVHQIRGEAKDQIANAGNVDIGAFRANVFSAVLKWHFMPRSFVTPYVGAGGALFVGQVHTIAPGATENTTIKFKNKFNYVVDAGADFPVARNFLIGADIRYSPYTAVAKNEPQSDSIDLNPITFSVGLRFRM